MKHTVQYQLSDYKNESRMKAKMILGETEYVTAAAGDACVGAGDGADHIAVEFEPLNTVHKG
jgi:hypothetical protein